MNGQTEQIRQAIENRRQGQRPFLVAIDGGSAGGKSTLGAALARELGATLVHMDDFFLPAELRTPQRLGTPGGNVHYERVLEQVLLPLRRGEEPCYGVFDCASMSVKEVCRPAPADTVILEGAYSLHPALREQYDLRVFLPVLPQTQRRRILKRNGPEKLQVFLEKWIPMERAYFEACAVEACCHLILPPVED